jgi:signal transduction histidine kinase
MRPASRGRCPESVPGSVTSSASPLVTMAAPIYARRHGATGGSTTEAVAGSPGARTPSAPHRAAIRTGWALAALSSTLVVAALGLDLSTGSYRQLLYLVISGALVLMGVLLTTRTPEQPIAWGFAATALLWTIGAFAYAYAVQGLVEDPGSLPGATAAAWLDNWSWLPILVLPMSLLLLVAPDGRLRSPRWRAVVVAVVSGTVLASLALSGASTFELDSSERIDNPLALGSTWIAVAAALGFSLVVVGVVSSFVSFVLRYRDSVGEQRQQLRWVGGSLVVGLSLGLLGSLTWGVFEYAYLLYAAALLVLPLGTAVAVLKYRLYEIDLVVNRALVYGVLTVCVVASYVFVVGLVGAVLSDKGDLVLALGVTGVVAVCFQPLRQRLQLHVNQLMYGERDDPYAALAGLGRRLETSLGADAVLPTVVETIGQTLKLQYVALALADSDDAAATYGSPVDAPLRFPLLHQGIAVGELRLAPRAGEELRVADHRLIADLAPQVAAAAHAVSLAEELQAANRRLVELREEERRRIRRDLHDGFGPALAGLTFTLDAVRNVSVSDLDRADALLASAIEQTQAMIGDVRRLIYGLRPPALDELGLVGSLRGLASRELSAATTVTVTAPDALPPLPAAVEVATYWIVQEALTNVARHAGARSCTVRLAFERDALTLEIADDGHGMEQRRIGVGLQTMRERATELGGSCQVTSALGTGTLVAVRLPALASTGGAG